MKQLGPIQEIASRMWRLRAGKASWVVIFALLGIAIGADFVASDKPLLLSYHGHFYVFPNITDPPELRAHNLQSLEDTMWSVDWMVPPPIPWGQNQQDKTGSPLSAPSRAHWLGTDNARRDVMARLVHGARVSIAVGLISVSIYILLGTLMGMFAGYFGGWVDVIISRLIEIIMTVPVFFLILAVMGMTESAGIGIMMLVIGLVYWTHVARLVRTEVLRLRQLEFVEAAQALGYSDARIMFRHILPNALGPILVAATFGVAGAILVEASLSFLGFGTPDSTASWGGLLRGAMGNFHAWWLVLFPGLAIFVTVSAYNIAGEVLRDVLDPRLRHASDRLRFGPFGG